MAEWMTRFAFELMSLPIYQNPAANETQTVMEGLPSNNDAHCPFPWPPFVGRLLRNKPVTIAITKWVILYWIA